MGANSFKKHNNTEKQNKRKKTKKNRNLPYVEPAAKSWDAKRAKTLSQPFFNSLENEKGNTPALKKKTLLPNVFIPYVGISLSLQKRENVKALTLVSKQTAQK